MIGRAVLFAALFVSIAIVIVAVVVLAPPAQPSPRPTAALSPTPVATTAAPSPSRTAAPSPTATAAPTLPPASPGSSPAAACPRQTGGSSGNQAQLTDVRIAHQPGFDRLVFELGPSTAPGAYGMPPYRIDVSGSLSGPSGIPVTVAGNATFAVNFQNASTVDPTSPTAARTYTGPSSIRPATPLIREVRLVSDFERDMLWGVGLDHLACPRLLELASPVRLVLDFPTPP